MPKDPEPRCVEILGEIIEVLEETIIKLRKLQIEFSAEAARRESKEK